MPRPSPDTWGTISRLLDEVLDLPQEARASWLAGLEAREPGAAPAVREWLDEFDVMAAGRFLEGTARPPAGLTGLEVGAYRLVERIGQGGMGAVWLGERHDGRFDQRVAVKILHAALMDESGMDRFARGAPR